MMQSYNEFRITPLFFMLYMIIQYILLSNIVSCQRAREREGGGVGREVEGETEMGCVGKGNKGGVVSKPETCLSFSPSPLYHSCSLSCTASFSGRAWKNSRNFIFTKSRFLEGIAPLHIYILNYTIPLNFASVVVVWYSSHLQRSTAACV